jgi:hypothetical protein
MRTIYVVRGSAGEYSDRNEWPICAYEDEALAQKFVELASALARVFEAKYEGARQNRIDYHRLHPGEPYPDDITEDLYNPYDPNFGDPEEVHRYWYDTVEVRDSLHAPRTDEEQARVQALIDKLKGEQ